jgi:hypothetical protein
MARLSSLSNTFFIICLEWDEEWSKAQINAAGEYIQTKNPWNRLLSVHGLPVVDDNKKMSIKRFIKLFKNRKYWEFSDEKWPAFIATQVGNGCAAQEVNHVAIRVNEEQSISHPSEEFGILRSDSDKNLRAKMWANFCGSASGGGTGSYIASFLNLLQKSNIQFQRMKPANSLLNKRGFNSFCLAEEGHYYVVYTGSGKVSLQVSSLDLVACWYNVSEPSPRFIPAGPVHKGQNEKEPPDTAKDWVLWITEKSNRPEG